MVNSRNIPPDAWEHARQALVYYFSRRVRHSRAEDLAQETLLTVWAREDYDFSRAEDFLRVCYGFASKILLKDRRESARMDADPSLELSLDDGSIAPVAEAKVLLDQVCQIGRTQLREQDWRLIELAIDDDKPAIATELGLAEANRRRVRLSRARGRLARLTFWRKDA